MKELFDYSEEEEEDEKKKEGEEEKKVKGKGGRNIYQAHDKRFLKLQLILHYLVPSESYPLSCWRGCTIMLHMPRNLHIMRYDSDGTTSIVDINIIISHIFFKY